MDEITVVDSLMGTGKTEWAIKYMNDEMAYKKFVYITPLLTEIERIKNSVGNRDFYEPENKNDEGRKLKGLKELLVRGVDIASTHSLFSSADDEVMELLRGAGYTLILDEVMDVLKAINITSYDLEKLLSGPQPSIKIEDNGHVTWLDDDYQGKFNDYKYLAKAGNLYCYRGKFLMWAFPPKIFDLFQEVYVMTYLFDGQVQKYYFDMYDFDYKYKSIRKNENNYELAPYDKSNDGREEVFELVNIYKGNLNDIGDTFNSFSATWLRRADGDILIQINKNLYSYFRNYCKTKSDLNMWTTLQERKSFFSRKGYARGFISLNTRATNDYRHKQSLAYVFNRYMNPHERAFFEENGVTVNEDLLAVSDLLQWVWRSQIREGKEINLYLPSSRMRGLLKKWGNYKL